MFIAFYLKVRIFLVSPQLTWFRAAHFVLSGSFELSDSVNHFGMTQGQHIATLKQPPNLLGTNPHAFMHGDAFETG